MSYQPVIRVIEGGGKGFRRRDVCGKEFVSDLITPAQPIACVEELVKFVKQDLDAETRAIAYAVAGDISNHDQVVVSPNLHFLDGCHLAQVTQEATGLQTYVANDMEAAVIGMSLLVSGFPYFLGITWSSGIGIRVFKNGQILSSSEGGHVCIDYSPFAQLCGCGQRGCVEAICAGKGVERRLIAELNVRGIKIPTDQPLFQFLDHEYMVGTDWAVDMYHLITTGMGWYLAQLQNILHLPAIIWKGTFAQKALFLKGIEADIRKAMRERLMNPNWEQDVSFYLLPVENDEESSLGAAKLAEQLLE